MGKARIRCITFTDGEESTLEADGQLEFSDASTRVFYAYGDYTFSVTAFATHAEIVRTGDAFYRVVLKEGNSTPIESALLQATVYTHALKSKRTENGFSFMASYSLGSGASMKLFITATLR